jgi:3-deoxy-manno-octulosonate cytidylyltransferase (CMP-KDO synthetase)
MYRIVVPARYGSTRLPGKALLPLAGKPMIQWVYERARQSKALQVLIATDDGRIVTAGRAFGAEVLLTAADHACGTDRIAEVARQMHWHDGDVIVNLQGDEPLMPVSLIDQVAALLGAHPSADIATLATPLAPAEALHDPNVVKVVTDSRQRALYFSRAPIPWVRDRSSTGVSGRRHLGIYAYRVAALHRLASLAPSALEQLEKLEQLRALENGMDIRVADALEVPGGDVNTLADVAGVEAILAAGL